MTKENDKPASKKDLRSTGSYRMIPTDVLEMLDDPLYSDDSGTGINTYIFDWARVIRDVSWRYAAKALEEVVGVNDVEKFKAACFPDLLERERGALSRFAFWSRVVSEYGLSVTGETVRRFVRAYQAVAAAPYPEVMALLRELKERPHVRVAILSNGAPELREITEASEERKLVDTAFYSCDLGIRKPSPAIFQFVLDALGAEPSRTLFVDDQSENTDAAAALGIHTILFKGPESVQQIRDFAPPPPAEASEPS